MCQYAPRRQRHRPVDALKDEALWYEAATPALWRWRMCLWEMRMATAFVARLRLGGGDVGYLAHDIEQVC